MIRLSIPEKTAIVRLFKKHFPKGKLYLFGSRVDPAARGGDIDLLCEQEGDLDALLKQQSAFLSELYEAIGEQKIDFILYRPSENSDLKIAKKAKETGVRLDMNIALDMEAFIATAERHHKHLQWAMKKMINMVPLTANSIENLSEENFAILEVFVSRFSKLQDILGKKILPAILQLTEEPGEYPTFIDKLNRLEKIGAIESVQEWKALCDIRNKFTHDYPDDPSLNATVINEAHHAAKILVDLYVKVKIFIANIKT